MENYQNIRGAEAVIRSLLAENVETIFADFVRTYPGDVLVPWHGTCSCIRTSTWYRALPLRLLHYNYGREKR